ncbi:MAG: amino acid ABC transporter substrate-binding protein [Anaerolineae bacterium]
MKRNNLFVACTIILSLLLVAACAAPAPTAEVVEKVVTQVVEKEVQVVVTAAPEEAAPIRIGVSLPLTGERAEPGTQSSRGYAVWAAMVNEAGGLLGRPVEIVQYDNASDADTAVSDYERLVTVDEVDLLVGPFSSYLVFPSAAVAEKYGMVFPEPAGGAPEIFERCFQYLFFAQPAEGRRQADTFVDLVRSLPEDQQPKTIALPTVDDPFNRGVIDRARELFTEAGYEIVYDEIFPQALTDFSPIAAKIKAANAEMLVAGTIFREAVELTRALQEVEYQPQAVFYTTAPSLPEFHEALGEATEGIIAAVSWHTGFATFQNAEFVAKYAEMFNGEEPAEDAANAFTVGQVLQQAVEQTKSIDNEVLKEFMHKATFNTVVGALSFDQCGKPQGFFHQLQWQGGNIEIVWPPSGATADLIWPKPGW